MSNPQTYALSLQQAYLWQNRESPSRRRHQVVVDQGLLDRFALQATLDQLTAEHEILRTTFAGAPGMTVGFQTVHDASSINITVATEPLETVRFEAINSHWDCSVEAPLRVVIVDTSLVITALAIALDPESLIHLASRFVFESPSEMNAPLQYPDFVAWQQEVRDDPDFAKSQLHWQQRQPEFSAHLPFELIRSEYATSEIQTAAGAPARASRPRFETIPVDIAPFIDSIDNIAATYACTRNDLIATAFHAFVHRLSDEPVSAVAEWLGVVDREDFAGSFGNFGGYRPSTLEFESNPTFLQSLDAYTRKFRSDATVGDALAPGISDASQTALLDYRMIAISESCASAWTFDIGVAAISFQVVGSRAQLVCDSQRFSNDTVLRFAAQFETLLAAIAHDPAQAVSSLNLINDTERSLVVDVWNQTQQHFSDETVVAAFERHAATTPEAIAAGNASDRLTYKQVDQHASAVAAALIDAGVTPGDAVGLCTDRSTAVLIAILAIWKAGAGYVPLNPDHPVRRIEHQLRESNATIVVTLQSHKAFVPESARSIAIDEIEVGSAATLLSVAQPDHTAYIMYTSGTTGLAKGVAVTQANLSNYSHALASRLGFAEATQPLHCATVTAISTDLGNTAIFPTLIAGGCVELIDADVVMDPNLFAQHAQWWPIDIIKITPSHLNALLTAGAERVLPRHTLVLGGEASSWPLVETVASVGRCRILNHYGPTETTIGSCTYDVVANAPNSLATTVPIGRPIANTQCYIVDLQGNPLPIGVPGELWIGGRGVASGYVGRSEETEHRFAPNPFHSGRVYRTGDKARWLPDGAIEFLGRVDDQVKIRGYRIEPREIEHVISTHPQVLQVAVIAREDIPGDRGLVAYIVADGNPTLESLRAVVAASLPDYMTPNAFVLLIRLPLTPSGKLDRRALPAPNANADFGRPYIAPSTDTQSRLAAIWCEVLRRDRVGIHDDFFALGGHSLLAAQVVARVRNGFGVQLPLHSLFSAPSVLLLAQEVDALGGGAIDDDELDALLDGLSAEEIEALLNES